MTTQPNPMAEKDIPEDDSQLRASLGETYHVPQPSDALIRRVSQLVSQQPKRTAQRRGVRLGLALAGALTVAMLLTLAWPTLVAARALYHMAGLMDDARSAHIIRWNVAPDGSRTKSEETWYQSGEWRIENASAVQIWTSGVLWQYEPQEKTATFTKMANGPFDKSHGFSLSPLLREAARDSWMHVGNIHDQGKIWHQGRWVHQVMLTNYPNFSHERVLILADPETDLPFEVDNQRETYDGWVTSQISELHYNQPLEARLFAVQFPAGTRLVDTETAQRTWQQKLSGEVARQSIGERQIVIRDLQVNAEGDVFLLYTAGQYPGDQAHAAPSLRDDQGTQYRQQFFFEPCECDTSGRFVRGFVIHGERLDGGWWVPCVPQQPWTPRRFTLTFDVNPHVEHVKMDMTQPGKVYQIGTGSTPQRATFTLAVARPACARLPEYAPYLGFQFQDWDLTVGDARIHAAYCRDAAHDLPGALVYYRQVIAARDEESRAIGQRMNDAQAWLDLYGVLRDLGQSEEAKQALLHARDEDVGHYNVERIKAEMKAHGLN